MKVAIGQDSHKIDLENPDKKLLLGGVEFEESEQMNNLTLDPMFSDGMVLQREKPIPVWGSGPAGELVTVTLAGKSASAIVWEDGT